MKAAHGSPPLGLARPNQLHSNSSYDGMKACSKSNQHTVNRSNKTVRMPPFLRLDSTGEVTSINRPQEFFHQETDNCRQGETSRPSAVRSTGGTGLFNKLVSYFVPQSSPHSNLLDSSSVQTNTCALDDLRNTNSKQVSDVTGAFGLAGQTPLMKMARTNLHLNRYGQWGSACLNSAFFLPRGVFPCHVFQARQSQRDPLHTCVSTSGQFVFKDSMAFVSGSSMFDSPLRFSGEKKNLTPHQKMKAASSHSSDISKSCENFCTHENQGTCACSVDKRAQEQPTWAPVSDILTNTVSPNIDIPQDSRQKQQQKESGVSLLKRTVTPNIDIPQVSRQRQQKESGASLGLPTCTTSTSSSTDSEENMIFSAQKMEAAFPYSSDISRRCQKACTHETAQTSASLGDMTLWAPVSKTVEKDEIIWVDQRCEGAECEEILQDRFYYIQLVQHKKNHIPYSLHWSWNTVALQSCVSSVSEESLFDSEDDEDCDSSETAETKDAQESEDSLELLLGNQFSLSDFLPGAKNQPCKKDDGAAEAGNKKACSRKACAAITAKWRKFYPPVSLDAAHLCTVQFQCGEGKDTVHQYEKEEQETLTAMEIQKARDLDRKHKNAAALLRKSSDEENIEASTGGHGTDVASLVEVQAGGPSAEEEALEDELGSIQVLLEGEDCEDGRNEDSDSEEEASEDEEEEDCDSDDSIVFEDD